MHVLREDLDARAAGRVDHRLQREERRADRDVDAVGGRDARQQRLDELLGLGDRLVHLPVARDQRRAGPGRAHDSASTPGSVLPSISSSDAPPPVDRWVTLSASPKRWIAAAESPPPTTVVPRRVGDRLGDRARAGGERLELERAHRAVPEHRAGPRDHHRVRLGGPRTDVEPHHPVGHVDAVDRLRLGVGGEPVGDHEVDRQLEAPPARRRRRRGSAWRARRPPRRTASRRSRGPARRGTGSTSRRRSGSCPPPRRKRSMTAILSLTLAPPSTATSGRSGASSSFVSVVHLALEQEPGGALGDEVRDALGRGVGAVRGAERVVDVDVGQRRQRRRELGIVLRLPRLVADVLEHEHVTARRGCRRTRGPRRRPRPARA